ncbi:MAG: ABC transporter permease [Bacteroidales bacterium]|nr:ABC transporter permease [Bacteroidales bacterium]
MRTIIYILQKEFLQIFRNRMMLPIIFVMPVIQLLILAHAATYDMKSIRTFIIDLDQSPSSRELVSKFNGSTFYKMVGYSFNYSQGEQALERDVADLIIQIPPDFEKDIVNEKEAAVNLVINAINGSSASLINAYTISIIRDFNLNLVANMISRKVEQPVGVEYAYWYNPELNYKTYMVPGILVLLVTIVALFLSGMNVVREKEIGTIEQLNVTPIKKYQFIAGKLLPFWIIAIFELALGLVVAKIFFDIPFVGSIGLVFGVAAVFLLVVLALGLIISTLADTMQQSMFLTWFFLVIFILMSGLFTAVESMPEWARIINVINPIAYFIEIMRMVMLKGSGLADIIRQFVSLFIYAVVALSVAMWRYKKVD